MKIEHLPRPTAARAAELLAVPIGDATAQELREVVDTLARVPQRDPKKSVAELLLGSVYDPTKKEKQEKRHG